MSIAEHSSMNGGGGGAPLPPQSIEAEESVLGAVLLSDNVMYSLQIDVGLRPEDFYRPQHAAIFGAMLGLFEQGEPVDRLTVIEKLKESAQLEAAGGASAIEGLAAAPPVVGNAAQYGKIVKETALVRGLLNATYRIQQDVADRAANPRDLLDHAERSILEVGHDDRRKDFRVISDVLDAEIDKLAKLADAGTAVTGTPSGFADIDDITAGFQPGNLIILAARPSMGKCLGGHVQVYDPVSGARRRIDSIVDDLEHGTSEAWVAALGPDFKLRPARVTRGMRSGRKPVFRVRTKLGRWVDATANHPLLTIRGWTPVEELAAGDRIAVPRTLPRTSATQAIAGEELVLLAALIADGDLTNRTPRCRSGADSPVLHEVRDAVEAIGARMDETGSIAASADERDHNPVAELLRRHGLMGLRSEHKFVPGTVFGLADHDIARFLAVLYACDGHVHASETLWQVGYTTLSERLARDVQHLLLRLGVIAMVRRYKRPAYDGTDTVAWDVQITGQADLRAFVDQVRARDEHVAPAAVPAGVVATTHAGAADPRDRTRDVHRRGISHAQLDGLAEALDAPDLRDLADADVWWDEIVAIEPLGEMETYDIEVPGDHNFVADDLVVHNSALAANFLENAAVRYNRPAVMFSLEMGESELAQRFLASQGGIKGNDLRRGKVAWPKVTTAMKALSQAPLWIDDSSDLSVLDVRAKARRLAQQVDGNLGLIVIDYLQLMRSDSRSENVVEQIGDISKGLKMLARELAVPVIALSQLSRGVESRHDKRPMLSDLRSSGQIEQDADLVMFIYREEYYEDDSEHQGEAELLIAKHRNGGLGTVPLVFQHEYPRFMPGVRDTERYAA